MKELLIEPAIVPDIFCSGLAEAEDLGDGNYRFTFYANQKSLHDHGGDIEHIIVARLILPVGATVTAVQATMKALHFSCCHGDLVVHH